MVVEEVLAGDDQGDLWRQPVATRPPLVHDLLAPFPVVRKGEVCVRLVHEVLPAARDGLGCGCGGQLAVLRAAGGVADARDRVEGGEESPFERLPFRAVDRGS